MAVVEVPAPSPIEGDDPFKYDKYAVIEYAELPAKLRTLDLDPAHRPRHWSASLYLARFVKELAAFGGYNPGRDVLVDPARNIAVKTT